MRKLSEREKGFTIIELLIVVAISGLVLSSIYSVFRNQLNAHKANIQAVEMQQNIRAAMFLMEREIRMAGYSPSMGAAAGIQVADQGVIQIAMDLDNDGDVTDPNETVSFGFSTANDANRDGQVDDGAGSVASLGRDTGGGFQPMSDNVEAVAFAYAYDSDQDGQLETSGGNVIWAFDSNNDGMLDTNNNTGAALGTAVALARIRVVRIWILARSATAHRGHTDTRTYLIGGKSITENDKFMRRVLTTTIKCRNMSM